MTGNLQKAIGYFTGQAYVPSGKGDWLVLEQFLIDKHVLPQEFVRWWCFDRQDAIGLGSLKFLSAMLVAVRSDEFDRWATDRKLLARTTLDSNIRRAAALRNCGLHVSAIATDNGESFVPPFRIELALQYLDSGEADKVIQQYKNDAVLFLVGNPIYLEFLPKVKEWITKNEMEVLL